MQLTKIALLIHIMVFTDLDLYHDFESHDILHVWCTVNN